MTDSANVHLLFAQLQTRYPTSSLVSELVQVHGDRFVVRALVQLGGVTLATGMAAAATIEQAEDEARLRALHVLGIAAIASSPVPYPVSGFTQPSALSSSPSLNGGFPPIELMQSPLQDKPPPINASPEKFPPENSPPAVVPSLPLEPQAISKPTSKPASKPKSVPSKPKDQDLQPVQEFPAFSVPGDPALVETLPEKPAASYSGEPELEVPDLDALEESNDDAAVEPVNLSELIAFTDVEMERIGWSKKRGQSHLKRTYNKQTRSELNEDQLMEFLHYLRALPSQAGE